MKIIVVLFYIYLVSASSCPNACSGHGICTTSGVCICNRQTGLALNNGDSNSFTYTGADCSQRTCPNGYSFATPWDLSTPIYPPTVKDPRSLSPEDGANEIVIEETSVDDIYEVSGANYSINAEGGALQCSSQKTKKPLGIANVLTMKTENEINKYYVRYDFTSDPSPDNYTCTVTSQRNDLSLFKPSKVKTDGKDYSIIYEKTKFIFEIMNWTLIKIPTQEEIEEDNNNNNNNNKAKAKEEESVLTQRFACYSNSDYLIKFYPIESMSYNRDNVVFDIGGDLDEIENNSTCYLLTKADGTPIRMSDSDLSKLCRRDNETGDWYYGIIDLSTINNNKNNEEVVSGKSEEGNYVLGVTETASKEIINILTNNTKFFIPIPQNDANSASISNIIIEGTLISVTIVYDDNEVITQRVRLMGVQANAIIYTNKDNMIERMLLEEIDEEDDKSTTTAASPTASNSRNNRIQQTKKPIKRIIRKRILQTPTTTTAEPTTTQPEKNNEGILRGIFTKTLPEISIKAEENIELILIEILNKVEDATHVLMECSGQGVCNRNTGECECYPGYDGEACQRLSCPNNCNGNGRCVRMTEGLINNEESNKYFGFGSADVNGDKVYVCLCDPGKRGPDCSMIECPSTSDPQSATNMKDDDNSEYRDCSGRGICDYNNGICRCFKGYYGEACQKMVEVQ